MRVLALCVVVEVSEPGKTGKRSEKDVLGHFRNRRSGKFPIFGTASCL
jgi:hypothetical protein